jgi:hypothetical protein
MRSHLGEALKGATHIWNSVLISATILLTISGMFLSEFKRWVVVIAGGVNVGKRRRGEGRRVGR